MFYITDLNRSALAPQDLDARPLSIPERGAINVMPTVDGYVIPYFDINGLPTPFWRARLYNHPNKYRQPSESKNTVYYPKNFMKTLNGHPYVVVTEGEKKAAAADKAGIPTIAFGGIYNWLNRQIKLPANAISTKTKEEKLDLSIASTKHFTIKLNEDLDIDRLFSQFADGFEDFVTLARERKLSILIAYDSSVKGGHNNGVTIDVQRACARLAIELRSQGISVGKIKQLVLPLEGQPKMGLDDYLVKNGVEALEGLIARTLQQRRGFPTQPDIGRYVANKLQDKRAARKDFHKIAMAIVADLDAKGSRLRSDPGGDMYYFDDSTKQLLPVTTAAALQGGDQLMFDDFRTLLYQRYGLTGADIAVQRVLTTLICAEDPIDLVKPRKGIFSIRDTIYHQISNSQYVAVNAGGIRIFDNGSNGIMFEARDVEPIDAKALVDEYERIREMPLRPVWADVLRTTRIKDDYTQRRIKLTTLLFYISPWLFRWRGTQLPIELATGEAGCGKSTLYGLRLSILTGSEDLRNRPQSLKDWHASAISTGGLHVVDNANLDGDPTLGQALSDEMCRMVTEPTPTVEMRKYYTEHGLIRVPVNIVFALTALRLPFRQLDLIARSFHVPLERDVNDANAYSYDADWASTWMASQGGRVGWTAHHLLVLSRFFQMVDMHWVSNYRAKFRLINFEQALIMMARVFGWETDWIAEYLASITQFASTEVDWILQGLKAFREHMLTTYGDKVLGMAFQAQSISDWASNDDEYSVCPPLCSSKKLATYIGQHPGLVKSTAGIQEHSLQNGRITYKLVPM